MRPIISIATIPSRVHFLKPVLLPLLDEGCDIYVWMPNELKRKDEWWDGIKPLWVSELDVHFKVVEDKGPITKILAALEIECQTIVTLDDDVIFSKGAIKNLLKYSNMDDESVFCYRGRQIKKGEDYNNSTLYKNVEHIEKCNFITGVHGVVYKKKFFDGWKPDYKKHFMVDDVVISSCLYNKGIPMYVVPQYGEIKNHFTHRIQPLYGSNNKKGNQNNNNAIKDLYAW